MGSSLRGRRQKAHWIGNAGVEARGLKRGFRDGQFAPIQLVQNRRVAN